MRTINFLLISMLVLALAACGSADQNGNATNDNDQVGFASVDDLDFNETESGLKYLIHIDSGGEKPDMEDILSLTMVYRVGDEVLFDSRDAGMPMFLPMMEPEYPGDIYEALSLMAVGDSATFLIDAERFFLETAGAPELPAFLEPGDDLIFDIKMEAALDEAAFAEEQQRLMEEQMQADMARAEQEEDLMLDYLAEEGITAEPTESGLYYVEREEGDGAQAQAGDMVAVHYEGRLLDGTVFDSSYERGEPIEFGLGQGQVIPGWDEGISMMREGGRATLVIPSHLAYGDRGAGQVIPPFSTLVFDVELIEVFN